jgi:hypothetical protein
VNFAKQAVALWTLSPVNPRSLIRRLRAEWIVGKSHRAALQTLAPDHFPYGA